MPSTADVDKRWLEFHGRTWRVTVSVPKDLRATLGTRLKRSLNTGSLAVANRRKSTVVAKLQAKIAAAQKDHSDKPKVVVGEAVEIAGIAERAQGPYERDEIDAFIRDRAQDILGAEVGYRGFVDEEGREDVHPLFDPRRERMAREFVAVATGAVLPLDALHGHHLSLSKVKRRTKADDARALRYLTAWCERERIPATVQAITGKVAVRFRDDFGDFSGGLHEVTQNKYLSRLSGYWKYLLQHEAVVANPFAGLKVAAANTPHREKERAFTDGEVQRPLTGGAEPRLMDLMMIAALSGARLDAIVDMKVKDAVDGAFTFKPQKKDPEPHDVPIHSALEGIVARRTVGREPDDDFFPEWPAPPPESERERSFKASNAFTKYRRSVGVNQVVAGKRRALTNFHSFRRWFCTKADRTGHPDRIIKAIVGHDGLGMTFGRYSEGPEWKAAKRCIAKIRLPPLDGSPVKEERPLRPRDRPGRNHVEPNGALKQASLSA